MGPSFCSERKCIPCISSPLRQQWVARSDFAFNNFQNFFLPTRVPKIHGALHCLWQALGTTWPSGPCHAIIWWTCVKPVTRSKSNWNILWEVVRLEGYVAMRIERFIACDSEGCMERWSHWWVGQSPCVRMYWGFGWTLCELKLPSWRASPWQIFLEILSASHLTSSAWRGCTGMLRCTQTPVSPLLPAAWAPCVADLWRAQVHLSECCRPSLLGRLEGLKAGIIEIGSVHCRAFVPWWQQVLVIAQVMVHGYFARGRKVIRQKLPLITIVWLLLAKLSFGTMRPAASDTQKQVKQCAGAHREHGFT